jgi:hypothetical protein
MASLLLSSLALGASLAACGPSYSSSPASVASDAEGGVAADATMEASAPPDAASTGDGGAQDGDGPTAVATAANTASLAFDGLDDALVLATVLSPTDPVNVTMTTAMTVEAWVKLDAAAGPFPQTVFESAFYANGVSADVYLTLQLTPLVRCRTATRAVNQLDGTTSVADGAWHHIACSSDGKTARVFVDGVQEGSLPNLISVPPGVTVLNVGRSGIPGFSGRLRGTLDELRVWTVARSATEIAMLQRVSLAGSAPGLAANWTFGEGSGQAVHDSTGKIPQTLLGGTANVEPADPSWSTDLPFP